MTSQNEGVQYLLEEHQAGAVATDLKGRVSAAGDRLKDALPDGDAVKSAVNGAAGQVLEQAKEVLPDAEAIRNEFLAAAHRLQEILPDGDDLKEMVIRVAEEVRDDPDIRQHLAAAADVASERIQGTVGSGIDAAAGTMRQGAGKVGLEDLGYVADRVGEIVKEGVGELVEETKQQALESLPEPEPYQKPEEGRTKS